METGQESKVGFFFSYTVNWYHNYIVLKRRHSQSV